MVRLNTINKKKDQAANAVKVTSADYLGEYRLFIAFNDGRKVEVDFADFLNNRAKGYLLKYKKPTHFKSFKIEDGNVVWGKDWDLVFPVTQLYNGHIE
jgi:hypothetical protein